MSADPQRHRQPSDVSPLSLGALDPRIRDAWAEAPGNTFPLETSLLAAVVMGSSAHNTRLSDGEGVYRADLDIAAVVVPPSQYLVGLDVWRPSGCWTWKGVYPDAEFDVQVHTLAKVFHELLRGAPNLVEWLWTRPEDTLVTSPAWEAIKAERHRFVAKSLVRRFLGFADGQLRRLNQSGTAKYDGEEQYATARDQLRFLGLDPEAAVRGDVPVEITTTLSAAWVHQQKEAIRSLMGRFRQMHEERERAFANPSRFTTARMGARRRAMVEAVGYDAKNACHMVRLLRIGVELATTGDFALFRTADAEELKAIKRGEWTLEALQEERNRLVRAIEAALATSTLPQEPDRALTGALYQRIIEERLSAAWVRPPVVRVPAPETRAGARPRA